MATLVSLLNELVYSYRKNGVQATARVEDGVLRIDFERTPNGLSRQDLFEALAAKGHKQTIIRWGRYTVYAPTFWAARCIQKAKTDLSGQGGDRITASYRAPDNCVYVADSLGTTYVNEIDQACHDINHLGRRLYQTLHEDRLTDPAKVDWSKPVPLSNRWPECRIRLEALGPTYKANRKELWETAVRVPAPLDLRVFRKAVGHRYKIEVKGDSVHWPTRGVKMTWSAEKSQYDLEADVTDKAMATVKAIARAEKNDAKFKLGGKVYNANELATLAVACTGPVNFDNALARLEAGIPIQAKALFPNAVDVSLEGPGGVHILEFEDEGRVEVNFKRKTLNYLDKAKTFAFNKYGDDFSLLYRGVHIQQGPGRDGWIRRGYVYATHTPEAAYYYTPAPCNVPQAHLGIKVFAVLEDGDQVNLGTSSTQSELKAKLAAAFSGAPTAPEVTFANLDEVLDQGYKVKGSDLLPHADHDEVAFYKGLFAISVDGRTLAFNRDGEQVLGAGVEGFSSYADTRHTLRWQAGPIVSDPSNVANIFETNTKQAIWFDYKGVRYYTPDALLAPDVNVRHPGRSEILAPESGHSWRTTLPAVNEFKLKAALEPTPEGFPLKYHKRSRLYHQDSPKATEKANELIQKHGPLVQAHIKADGRLQRLPECHAYTKSIKLSTGRITFDYGNDDVAYFYPSTKHLSISVNLYLNDGEKEYLRSLKPKTVIVNGTPVRYEDVEDFLGGVSWRVSERGLQAWATTGIMFNVVDGAIVKKTPEHFASILPTSTEHYCISPEGRLAITDAFYKPIEIINPALAYKDIPNVRYHGKSVHPFRALYGQSEAGTDWRYFGCDGDRVFFKKLPGDTLVGKLNEARLALDRGEPVRTDQILPGATAGFVVKSDQGVRMHLPNGSVVETLSGGQPQFTPGSEGVEEDAKLVAQVSADSIHISGKGFAVGSEHLAKALTGRVLQYADGGQWHAVGAVEDKRLVVWNKPPSEETWREIIRQQNFTTYEWEGREYSYEEVTCLMYHMEKPVNHEAELAKLDTFDEKMRYVDDNLLTEAPSFLKSFQVKGPILHSPDGVVLRTDFGAEMEYKLGEGFVVKALPDRACLTSPCSTGDLVKLSLTSGESGMFDVGCIGSMLDDLGRGCSLLIRKEKILGVHRMGAVTVYAQGLPYKTVQELVDQEDPVRNQNLDTTPLLGPAERATFFGTKPPTATDYAKAAEKSGATFAEKLEFLASFLPEGLQVKLGPALVKTENNQLLVGFEAHSVTWVPFSEGVFDLTGVHTRGSYSQVWETHADLGELTFKVGDKTTRVQGKAWPRLFECLANGGADDEPIFSGDRLIGFSDKESKDLFVLDMDVTVKEVQSALEGHKSVAIWGGDYGVHQINFNSQEAFEAEVFSRLGLNPPTPAAKATAPTETRLTDEYLEAMLGRISEEASDPLQMFALIGDIVGPARSTTLAQQHAVWAAVHTLFQTPGAKLHEPLAERFYLALKGSPSYVNFRNRTQAPKETTMLDSLPPLAKEVLDSGKTGAVAGFLALAVDLIMAHMPAVTSIVPHRSAVHLMAALSIIEANHQGVLPLSDEQSDFLHKEMESIVMFFEQQGVYQAAVAPLMGTFQGLLLGWYEENKTNIELFAAMAQDTNLTLPNHQQAAQAAQAQTA